MIDPRQLSPIDLSKLLRDSAVKFIENAYNSYEYQTTFAATWDELSESDQLDVSIAQEQVVENGFLILAQLGLRTHPQIASILDKWDAAQRLLAERSSGAIARPTASRRNADAEMREAKSQLRVHLESNHNVQSRILDAVRERIAGYYQYTRAAVPFEVFQNADDASIEFIAHFKPSPQQHLAAQTFHLIRHQGHITFAHFGRRINQIPLGAGDSTEVDPRSWTGGGGGLS